MPFNACHAGPVMVRNAAGLSEAALIWGTSEARGEVVSVSPLGGGITHTKWVLVLAGGERVVLRWADPTRWGSIGREHVRREVLACQLLADSPIPVPGLISSDVDGRVAGGPASLLSWRGGHARL